MARLSSVILVILNGRRSDTRPDDPPFGRRHSSVYGERGAADRAVRREEPHAERVRRHDRGGPHPISRRSDDSRGRTNPAGDSVRGQHPRVRRSRTTWARRGVLAAFGMIDAGFSGTLTFGALNGGSDVLELPIGERFAQIVFLSLESPSSETYEKRSGTYQGQRGVTLERP